MPLFRQPSPIRKYTVRLPHSSVPVCSTAAASRASTMPRQAPSKRKASVTNGTPNGVTPKRAKTYTAADPLRAPHPFHEDAEEHGIVLRQFYPHEMSNARARAYNDGEIPRPIELVNSALS